MEAILMYVKQLGLRIVGFQRRVWDRNRVCLREKRRTRGALVKKEERRGMERKTE